MSGATLVALFGAGVASFLAPCVLPLVPAWIAMMGAESGETERSALVGSTLLFVAGFAAVFVAAGAAFGGVGSLVTSSTASRIGGAIVVVFGVALLIDGVGYRFPVLHVSLSRWRRRKSLRALALGLSFGASWTPCVGPLLGSALVVASSTGGTAQGAVLLGVYALGLGLPFVITSLALSTATPLLRRIARHAVAVRRVGGVALVVLGLALTTGNYPRLVTLLASARPR